MGGSAGTTEQLVRRLAVRYSVLARTATALVCGLLGVVVAPVTWLTAVLVGFLAVWSGVFAVVLLRGGRWVVPVDVLIVSGVCLTQIWTVPTAALQSDEGWVIALASMTLVVYQWCTGLVTSVLAVVAVDGAFLAGVLLALPTPAGATTMVIWMPVEAALSRMLWWLVRRGAQAADQARARAEQTRRDATVAAAARSAEREYAAVLHDTAASTLLMVGLGEVGGHEVWLRAQAKRDLRVFTVHSRTSGGETDLVPLLREVVETARVDVTCQLPDTLPLPHEVATALAGAAQEALTNVARHASTKTASLSTAGDRTAVVLEIRDHGCGFAPDRVPVTRRGITGSIVDRVAAAGGHATVHSRRGEGTTVRLEWRDG